ncbi:hypothetical protein [Halalkalicoccus salilacus]|uniref:hypothetical protein n=1 Tax=Halalkalicoccus TaxID=332246 RepID=UPI002F9688CB
MLAAVYRNGGGETLQQYGALSGDDIPAHKARIKLLLALEEITTMNELHDLFGSW